MIGFGCSMRTRIQTRTKMKFSQKYNIIAVTICPYCKNITVPKQENWVDSDTDCRMVCSNCQEFYKATLQIFQKDGVLVDTYDFLCPEQTLYEMRSIKSGRKNLGEKFLHNKHPKVYFSLLRNFGSYKKARKKM